jgi:glycogen operon protein
MATRLVGSPDLYGGRAPRAGVNYVTAHDGFTLRDLVSYDRKHNEANGEQDRDGAEEELSWNCGIEGHTEDAAVLALRARQQRNALLLLLLSRGTPMLLGGDERGRTQSGNSNAYCHDSELTWVDWALEPLAERLTEFTRRAIALRHAHPAVHSDAHPDGQSRDALPPSVSWHGVEPWQPDWDSPRPLLAAMYCEPTPDGAADLVYLVANADANATEVRPPAPPPGYGWALAADTGADTAAGIAEVGHERRLGRHPVLHIAAYSVTVLVAVAEAEIQEPNRTESP